MKLLIHKIVITLSIILINTTVALANEGGKLAEGFTDLFISLLAKLFLFVFGFWLVGQVLNWLINKIRGRDKPQ